MHAYIDVHIGTTKLVFTTAPDGENWPTSLCTCNVEIRDHSPLIRASKILSFCHEIKINELNLNLDPSRLLERSE